MAFNYTVLARKFLNVIGATVPVDYGIVALSGGTATVKTSLDVVEIGIAQSQTANAARVSATSGRSITITGTGTDAVMWMAIGKGGR